MIAAAKNPPSARALRTSCPPAAQSSRVRLAEVGPSAPTLRPTRPARVRMGACEPLSTRPNGELADSLLSGVKEEKSASDPSQQARPKGSHRRESCPDSPRIEVEAWMIGRLAIVGVVALALIVVVTQAGGGKAAQATIAQSCPGGSGSGVTVSLVWPAVGGGRDADLPRPRARRSVRRRARSRAIGPFDPALTAYALAGLPEGVVYHYRVQSLTADGWKLNARGSFTTACGVPPVPGDVTQRCVEGPEPGGVDDGVSATFSWKAGAEGEQWVDVTVQPDVFAPEFSRGYGPAASGAVSFDGRRPRARHKVLVARERPHAGRLDHERDRARSRRCPVRGRSAGLPAAAEARIEHVAQRVAEHVEAVHRRARSRGRATPPAAGTRGTCDASELSITPHDGNGGGIPYPRKLIVASARIAVPMPMLANTITTGSTFGTTWRKTMRVFDAPSVRAASTYWFAATRSPRRARRGSCHPSTRRR